MGNEPSQAEPKPSRAEPFPWTMGGMPQPCGVVKNGSKKDEIDLVDWMGGLGDGVKSRQCRRLGCGTLSLFELAVKLLWFRLCGE